MIVIGINMDSQRTKCNETLKILFIVMSMFNSYIYFILEHTFEPIKLHIK